jgi:tetratricopeptide (TPR) repeat protein
MCYRGRAPLMRLAILAASSYSGSDKIPELPTSEMDLDLLGQRLGEPDAAFTVHIFRAERGLAEAVDQVIAQAPEPIDELLFYFLGYAVVSDERGPALLLAGDRLGTLSLKRLRRVLAEKAKRSLAVLDLSIAFDPEADPEEANRTLGAALIDPTTPVSLLASSKQEVSTGRAPFTSMVELVLDWHSVKSGELSSSSLYGAMRAEESMFAELRAVEHFSGSEPFVLLRGSAPPSMPPPASLPPPAEDSWQAPAAPTEDERGSLLEQGRAALEAADVDTALDAFRKALAVSPRDIDVYRSLLTAFERGGRPDGRFHAASALDVLGAADVNESLLASAHRPEGLPPALGVLSEEDWKRKLLCVERDAELDNVFTALEKATLAVGMETVHRKRRGPALEPSTEQDLEKSTTTLARTLAWAARLLGFVRPRFHVLDSVGGVGLAVAPVEEPTLLASRALGSGFSLSELVFLWSRTLVLLRPEHRALVLFTGPKELEMLLSAVVSLGSDAPRRGLDSDAKLITRSVRRHLRGPSLAAATEAAKRVSSPRLEARLAAFKKSVALAGGRAGLLASSNLELAIELTERFPDPDAGPVEDQVADLLRFSVSAEYAALRERIGVALKAS